MKNNDLFDFIDDGFKPEPYNKELREFEKFANELLIDIERRKYIKMLKENELDEILLPTNDKIDYISHLEHKKLGNISHNKKLTRRKS